MKKNTPVDPRVRLAIAHWPNDAPRGAVTTFCMEHEITRKTFYTLRKRALRDGPAAILEPRSRRPRTSPTKISDELKQQAVNVRAALERSGLDHGPISVHERMKTMGLAPPSVASLARIFRETGVARQEPRKKPRAAYRRFVYPAPNACWQLDATEYILTAGRKCVIFQLIDDHSRLAVASLAAAGETSDAAIEVVRRGIERYGVPQKLLTDNGAALNPTRRGQRGMLVDYVSALGVEPITGKPYKPTTQGKNERFHQTLMRWLDHRPLARDIDELQALVNEFDVVYNTQRPHQGLPGRITPQQAWDATEVAAAPRSPHLVPGRYTYAKRPESGESVKIVSRNTQASALGVLFHIGPRWVGQHVHVQWDAEEVAFYSMSGDFLIRYARPEPGTVRWVAKKHALEIGAARDLGVTDVLRDEVSPMS